jgi:hypothetical protein
VQCSEPARLRNGPDFTSFPIVNRLFLFLFAVGLVVAPCDALAGAHGDIPGPAADRLVEAVRAELPQGWSVSCDKVNGWLNITRDQPVLVWWADLPNAAPPALCATEKPIVEKREPEQYFFNFGIVPKISPAEYRRLKEENAEFARERKALHAQLVKMGMSDRVTMDPDQNFKDFKPHTEEQRAVAARYSVIKDADHQLPVFYFGDVGLDWGWHSPKYRNFHPEDETIRKECDRVHEKVIHIFTIYGGDEGKAPPMKANPVPNLSPAPGIPLIPGL